MRSRLSRSIGATAALATAGALLIVPQAATAAADDETTDIQILTINDFHGRLEQDLRGGVAGAAGVVGAVKAFEAENPNTLFVSAGDNIGASTFTSFIQDDEPTIEALAKGGLSVSAVGNHEFDKGFADLVDRVIPSFDGHSAEAGAELALGANVYHRGTEDPALAEYAIREVDGVRVGFIGTITADTRTLVSPAGIEEIDFGDQVEAANRVAAEIDDQVDVTVLLTHSGAEFSVDDVSDVEACTRLANEQTEFGALVRDADASIDAIVSGHTHQGYPCEIEGRPVIQANDYGKTLGRLDVSVDAETNELVSIGGSLVPLVEDEAALYPSDEATQAIVDDAVAYAEVEGNVPVGEISADILRAGATPGDDRGSESTMGNLVADVYLWATTEYANYGGEPADLAVMNPGGLREDLWYASSDKGEGDGVVTYAEAAAVQPFANTLTTSELTGADIRQMLEQQWQPGQDRPKLHLGISDGFAYEYVDDAPAGEHVQSVTLNGEEIADDETYIVTTNVFVAAGGDGFTAFDNGPYRDTGLIDLAATVDYFAAHDVVDPAPLGRAVAVDDEEPGEDAGETGDDAGESTDDAGEGSEDAGEATDDAGESADDGAESADAGEATEDGAEGAADDAAESGDPGADAGEGSEDGDLAPTGGESPLLFALIGAGLLAAGLVTIGLRRHTTV